jgi:hypothetical protein
MLRFQLTSDERLHFATKANFQSEGRYLQGILILTDRRVHFGCVTTDFYIDIYLEFVKAVSAEIPPDEWPPITEKECLTIIENKQYEFNLNDSVIWKKKIFQRPAVSHLRVRSPASK